jgi:hypothetical protein
MLGSFPFVAGFRKGKRGSKCVRITLGIDRPDVAIFPVLRGRMRRRLAPPRRDKLKAHGHETSGAFFACDAFHRR